MVRLNINLDDSLKDYADQLIAQGRARNVDDLVASLLADVRNREQQESVDGLVSAELEATLLEADEDPGTPMTPQDWEELRKTVVAVHRGTR